MGNIFRFATIECNLALDFLFRLDQQAIVNVLQIKTDYCMQGRPIHNIIRMGEG